MSLDLEKLEIMLNANLLRENKVKKLLTSGLVWSWVAILIIAIDRISKMWVVTNLQLHEPVAVLPVFNLTLWYNTGAAFSFLHNMSGWQNWFLGSLAFIVSIVVIGWMARIPARSWWLSIALAFILGGALGNAWDRILYGYVIDFLSFHWGDWYFAIFNVADSAICVGAAMVLLHWLLVKK